jgi:hypothetical protein
MHMPSEFASLRQGMTTDTSTASVSTFVANVVICGRAAGARFVSTNSPQPNGQFPCRKQSDRILW